MQVLELLSVAILVVVGTPTAFFCLETLTGCVLPYRKNKAVDDQDVPSIRASIIIPAHNEEEVIAETLKSLKRQVTETDHVLVVADNCTDSTASIVKEYGFDVVERSHPTDRGKGFALAFGLDQLRDEKPDIVVIVDADCLLEDGALRILKQRSFESQRPVQAKYLIKNKPDSGNIKSKVSEFALVVKNHVRFRGLNALGIGVPLAGTGMAFPWNLLQDCELASGEIVEDMKLGIDLAIAGKPTIFDETASVYSYLPTTEEALTKQRERWEHGHLGMIQKYYLSLIGNSIKKRDLGLFGVFLDITIPPLTFLLALCCLSLGVLSAIAVFNPASLSYTLIFLALVSLLGISVLFAWARFGQGVLSFQELLKLPIYVLSKLSIYKKFFKDGRQKSWVKTDRK